MLDSDVVCWGNDACLAQSKVQARRDMYSLNALRKNSPARFERFSCVTLVAGSWLGMRMAKSSATLQVGYGQASALTYRMLARPDQASRFSKYRFFANLAVVASSNLVAIFSSYPSHCPPARVHQVSTS